MLRMERLEPRTPLSLDCVFCDINNANPQEGTWGDGVVTSNDVLVAVNRINAGGIRCGVNPRTDWLGWISDVNNDGCFSSLDVLCIVNELNAQANADFNVCIVSHNTTGFDPADVLVAMQRGFQRYTKRFGVTYSFLNGRPCDVRVQTTEIYLGNGVHAGGLYAGGIDLFLHNGRYSAFQHSGRLGPRNQPAMGKVFATLETIEEVMAHEYGHQRGLGHFNDPNCIMHIGAFADDFCAAEAAILARGFAGGLVVDPEESVDFLFLP